MRIILVFACVILVTPPTMQAQEPGLPPQDSVDGTPDTSIQHESPQDQVLPMRVRELLLMPSPDEEMLATPVSAELDTVHAAPARKLIPDNASWLEKGMWGEDGFVRNIGIAYPLTPEVRKSELAVRRTMLTMHQIGGFVTLGLMGTAVYWGQKTLNYQTSRFNDPTLRSYRGNHQTFVTLTIISYGLTGALAALSPPPLIRRDEVSTTTIHKTLAWVHLAGMILTPIIGASLHHSMNYDQLAHFHQISAYVTTATLAASLIVITF